VESSEFLGMRAAVVGWMKVIADKQMKARSRRRLKGPFMMDFFILRGISVEFWCGQVAVGEEHLASGV
jgi:hypothetical protein